MSNSILSKRQIEVMRNVKKLNPKHIIFHGAIRSGKTFLAILFWDTFIRCFKRKTFIMTGYTVGSLRHNVLDPWMELFPEVQAYPNTNNEFKVYGNKICCYGTDKSDSYKSLRGITSQGWFGNEITLSHVNSVLEAIGRCSEDGAKIIWDCNPDKPQHFVKKDYIDRSGIKLKSGNVDILAEHFKLSDNTFLPVDYIEKIKSNYPDGVIFDRLINGLWKITDAAIFNNLNIINSLPPEHVWNDYCYGLDFGFNHPTVLVKNVYVDGNLNVELQFCESKLITSDIVSKVQQCIYNKNTPIYCDCAEPDKIEALQRAGYNAVPADKSPGTVLKGINQLKEYKYINLVYNPVLIRQTENYEWKKTHNNDVLDEPVKIDDDCPDAIRYGDYNHNKNKISLFEDSVSTENFDDNFKF